MKEQSIWNASVIVFIMTLNYYGSSIFYSVVQIRFQLNFITHYFRYQILVSWDFNNSSCGVFTFQISPRIITVMVLCRAALKSSYVLNGFSAKRIFVCQLFNLFGYFLILWVVAVCIILYSLITFQVDKFPNVVFRTSLSLLINPKISIQVILYF